MTKDIPFEEKAKIFDILKFTPCNYNVNVYGYGGEVRFVGASKEQYLYFKKNNIDIEDYADDYENELNVPEEMQPFNPGSIYDSIPLESACGATMESSSTIEITDEHNRTVFTCDLDVNSLDDEKVLVLEVGEFYPEYNCKKGDVVIYNASGEKGTFFGGEIHMTKPFDPSKLKITFIDMDGWMILDGITYDNIDIENNDYSTNGKWSETKWVVVGGEESIDDNEQDNVNKTEWYPTDINPVREGAYECMFGGTEAWPFSNIKLIEWDGEKWDSENTISKWRGLTNVGYLEQLKLRT